MVPSCRASWQSGNRGRRPLRRGAGSRPAGPTANRPPPAAPPGKPRCRPRSLPAARRTPAAAAPPDPLGAHHRARRDPVVNRPVRRKLELPAVPLRLVRREPCGGMNVVAELLGQPARGHAMMEVVAAAVLRLQEHAEDAGADSRHDRAHGDHHQHFHQREATTILHGESHREAGVWEGVFSFRAPPAASASRYRQALKLTAGSGAAVAALPAERGGDALGLRHARHGGNRGVQLRLRQQGGRRRGEPLPCRPFWRQLAPRPGGKAFQDVGQFQVCRLPLPHGPPLPGGGAGHLQARRQDHPQQAAGGNQFQQRHSTSRVLHNNLLIKAINGRNMPTTTNITINPSASTAGGKSNCARAWR